MKLRIVHEHWPAGWVGRYSQKLTRWYELHTVNKSVVAKSNGDLYPKSLEAMADKSVSPWAVVIRLLRSGQLLSVANQSSLPYSESYLRQKLDHIYGLIETPSGTSVQFYQPLSKKIQFIKISQYCHKKVFSSFSLAPKSPKSFTGNHQKWSSHS